MMHINKLSTASVADTMWVSRTLPELNIFARVVLGAGVGCNITASFPGSRQLLPLKEADFHGAEGHYCRGRVRRRARGP
jgi:hypothetical protein